MLDVGAGGVKMSVVWDYGVLVGNQGKKNPFCGPALVLAVILAAAGYYWKISWL